MRSDGIITWDRRLRTAVVVVGMLAAASLAFVPSGCGDVGASRQELETRRREIVRNQAEKLANQAARHQQELQQRITDPVHAALVDPALDLRALTERIALLVVPEAKGVAVTVERFSEFHLSIRFNQAPRPAQMAAWTRRIVPPLRSHLSTLRFVAGDQVVGRLGREDLESTVDWNAMSSDELERRLSPRITADEGVGRDPKVYSDMDEPTNPHWAAAFRLTMTLSDNDLALARRLDVASARLRESAKLTARLDFKTLELRVRSLSRANTELLKLEGEFRSLEGEYERMMDALGFRKELVAFLRRVELPRWKSHVESRIRSTRTRAQLTEALGGFLEELRRNPRLWKAGEGSIAVASGREGDAIRSRIEHIEAVLIGSATNSALRFEEATPKSDDSLSARSEPGTP